jgi:hypothetical protein
MLNKLVVIGLAALTLIAGCCNGNCGNPPVVSPTNVTIQVQSPTDPVLPPYTPWWVEEK